MILAHKYLDLIGASLAISSSPGKGSVFNIIFPSSMEVHGKAADSAGKAVVAPAQTAPKIRAQRPRAVRRITIVVVEDQPDQALFMRALLQNAYAMVFAVNPTAAMARLEELGERVGLILMDVSLAPVKTAWRLPGGSGRTGAGRICP